jgi:hypothetical protein
MNECLGHHDVHFPAYEQAAEIAQPREGAFDFPPSPIAPPLATVLPRGLHPMAAMGTNQLNAPLRQALSPWVRGTGLLVEHTLRLLARSPGAVARDGNGVQGRFPQRHVCRGSRVPEVSPRKTLAVDHHQPLRPRATCGLADAGPPFFAGAKLPSAKVSAPSSWPWASSCAKNPRHPFSHTPGASQSRRRRQQVLGDGNRAGTSCHRAPLRRPQRRPSKTGRCGMGFGPPLGEALSAGHKGALLSHCASVSSDCARALAGTPFAADDNESVPPRQPPVVRGYETASNLSAM